MAPMKPLPSYECVSCSCLGSYSLIHATKFQPLSIPWLTSVLAAADQSKTSPVSDETGAVLGDYSGFFSEAILRQF